MMITESVLKQQRDMAQAIKDKLDTIIAPDDKKQNDLDTAKAYCEGCILACELVEGVLKREIDAKEKTKAPEAAGTEEPAETPETTEEKPKKRSHKKKKPAKDDSMTLEDAVTETDNKDAVTKPDKADNEDTTAEPAPDNAITTEDETVDLGESSSAPADDDDLGDLDDLF